MSNSAEAYIQHHLEHLKLNLNTFTIGDGGFWTLNLDTFIVGLVTALLIATLFRHVAKRMTEGVPGKLQNFVEMTIEFVHGSVKDTFHGKNALVAPLALTLFAWIFVMNALDLLPVDFLPGIVSLFGVEHLKIVPTADPNMTFAMSISIFFLIIFFLQYCGQGLAFTKRNFDTAIWALLIPTEYIVPNY